MSSPYQIYGLARKVHGPQARSALLVEEFLMPSYLGIRGCKPRPTADMDPTVNINACIFVLISSKTRKQSTTLKSSTQTN